MVSTPKRCPSFHNGECRVASKLAGMTVLFDVRACDACATQPNPQAVNKVTTDIAAHALRQAGKTDQANTLLGIPTSRPIGPGIGKTFATMAGWINLDSPNCRCRDYLRIMNQWGSQRCTRERARIAKWWIALATEQDAKITTEEMEALILKAADQHRPPLQTAADCGPPLFTETTLDGPGERVRPRSTTRVSVDFVLPYGPREVKYMPDALRSVGWQQSADIHLHLIPDAGAERVAVALPPHVTVHWYERTDGKTDRLGPYRIANAIAARHTRTPWLFVCDADDISLPTRAWESVATAERHGCEQVGGELISWCEAPNPAQRLLSSLSCIPRYSSGTTQAITPLGNTVNSTRCVSVEAFRRINGFEDWPVAADVEFDTRSRRLGVNTYSASVTWVLHRIREGAATNSAATGMGTTLREKLHREITRRLSLPVKDIAHFGAMHRDVDLLREVKHPRVGFVSNSYSSVGGVSVWHQTLLPRLQNVAGFVCFDEQRCFGNLSLLGCKTGVGFDAAKELAARCDVLVVWGLGKRLGDLLGSIAPPPRVISVVHSDHRSQWEMKTKAEEAPWTDRVVFLNPAAVSVVPQRLRSTATLIPNAAAPERIVASRSRTENRELFGLSDDDRLLLVCSRISSEKRLERLIEAVKLLPPRYHLIIAGTEGREATKYGDWIRSMVDKRVTLVGHVDLPGDLLAASDAYLSASLLEGYGLAVAEAMLAGVPVISTRTGVLESKPELAKLVNHDADARGWAAAIEEDFSADLAQRARASRAQAIMTGEHSVERFAGEWQRLILG